jgi:hypothetical protein
MTSAEEVLAGLLEHRIGSVPLGQRLRIVLDDQPVYDGVRWRAGPHTVGSIERVAPGALQIKLVSTPAGRTAAALLEMELLDVGLSRDFPPSVRLADGGRA